MALAVNIKQLFAPAQLGLTPTTLYTNIATNPANTVMANGKIRFTNTSNSSQNVWAYAVPNGGNTNPGNCFMNAETIGPNAHLDVQIPVLALGDTLQALAGQANAVSVFCISGAEITP